MELARIYERLLEEYGPQGWWPIVSDKCEYGVNAPRNRKEVFEICVGAILTQNTSWLNVEKALLNLKKGRLLDPGRIIRSDIREAIRPAGYYNQKERKLKEFSRFFIKLEGIPSREELLGIWGIGKETADSILLYAFNVPSFVVDAYTRRIFSGLKLVSDDAGYDDIRLFFERNLEKDAELYKEFHALIVEHAKRYYSRKPYGRGCFLKRLK